MKSSIRLKTHFGLLVILVTSCRATNSSYVAPPTALTFYAEGQQQTDSAGPKLTKDMHVEQVRIWAKGTDQFRIENHSVGYVIVEILNGQDRWIFGSAGRIAYHRKKPPSSKNRIDNDYVGGPQSWKQSGAVQLKQGSVDGISCDVFQRKIPEGSMKAWFPRDGIPIPKRIVMTGDKGLLGGMTSIRTVITLSEREKGVQMDDAFFRPPPGYSIHMVEPNGPRTLVR